MEYDAPLQTGCAEWLKEQGRIVLLAMGNMVQTAWEASEELAKEGIDAAVVNARFAAPIDAEMIRRAASYDMIVTLEENVLRGGFGETVAAALLDNAGGGCRGGLLRIGLPDKFMEQGSQAQLRRCYGLDTESVVRKIKERWCRSDEG